MKVRKLRSSLCRKVPWLMLLAIGLATAASVAVADERQKALAAAALIDRHIFGGLERAGIAPAPPATDAEFLRRVWLDIAGKIPPASRARQILNDTQPDKRYLIVEELLERSGYVHHFTAFWRDILLPEVKSDERVQQLLPGFDAWLRQHLGTNTPYNRLAYEIINAPIDLRSGTPQTMRSVTDRSAVAFFQAKEIAPENLAAATSRIFLGIRIECAQCHDHPFDDWTQQQFWSYASFFAGIERQGNQGVLSGVAEVFDRRELRIPETDIVVQAGYLDGSEPQWRRGTPSRQILADWITSANNPYFARMAVNRMWGKFFGVGLVDPVDDFTSTSACSHPELLAALTQTFVDHDYDLKFLIRAIACSRAYQLSSSHPRQSPQDDKPHPQSFASMAVKGLTAEQLFDSLAEAAGKTQALTQGQVTGDMLSPRGEILELFANDTDPTTQQQTSILQALALMNGQFVGSAVDLQQSATLTGAVDASTTTRQRVESLFYATLSRPPSSAEERRFVEYVNSGRTTQAPAQALADVFWALLNSAEFATNH